MLHIYRPDDEDREWRSVSMSLRLSADINYLLDKQAWGIGCSKQTIVTQLIEKALNDKKFMASFVSEVKNEKMKK
ncbi:Uncharacterised protein [Yersinia aldovae]|uniref:hypothetical protein n=1 Tax=Yersinia aldovae TaxID=29483 RepID=UPI0005E10CA9|nr:hypothetical protein [Yersinia aldovae]CNK25888.1 Uncharacterised protein [Yersinia aldovae]